MPLTEFQVKNAKPSDKPHKLADGGGLYLLVQPSGTKLWWLKCRCAEKEKVLAFGAYPLIGIADTCTAREEAKKLLATGTDPALKRHEEKVAIVPVVAPPSMMKRRVLAVVDTVSRPVPAPDPRHSYCGEDVVQTLKRVCRQVGCQENPCRSGANFCPAISANGLMPRA